MNENRRKFHIYLKVLVYSLVTIKAEIVTAHVSERYVINSLLI